jgi:DNA-binding MltR family transcriptional regulator
VSEAAGFFVKGSVEEAYRRALTAWHDLARSQVEESDPPDWTDLIEFFRSLTKESDRAVPILAFTYIDSEILRLMSQAMDPRVHGGLDALFGPLGSLGSASARINIAHALRWLTSDTVHDLHLLRRLRNRFAHDLVREGFNDPEAVRIIAKHRLMPRVLEAALAPEPLFDKWEDWAPPSARARITRAQVIVAAALTAWTTIAQLYVAPASVRSGVNPAVLLDPKSSTAPHGIVAQGAAFERFMMSLVEDVMSPDWAVMVEQHPPPNR